MCLGVPGKVISFEDQDILRMGQVSFAGVMREVSLVFVPEAKVGDFVIVHVGFAISLLDPNAAERTLQLLDQLENTRKEPKREIR